MVAIEYTLKELAEIVEIAGKIYESNDPRITPNLPASTQYAEAFRLAEEHVRSRAIPRVLSEAQAKENMQAAKPEAKEEQEKPSMLDFITEDVADLMKKHAAIVFGVIVIACAALVFAVRPEKKPEPIPARYATAQARYDKDVKNADQRYADSMKAAKLRYEAAKACQDLRQSGIKCEIQ